MSNANPDPDSRPDSRPDSAAAHERHQHVVSVLARALLLNVRASRVPHAVQLDALLSAYVTELVLHPCCYESAAKGLRQIASQVEALHAENAAGAEQLAQHAIHKAAQRAV